MDMTEIIDPIQDELESTKAILREALTSNVDLVSELARYTVAMKGKLLRPVLVLLSAKACGTVSGETMRAAAGLELIHVATLIHDDVVDGSEMRRGVPCLHSIWSSKTSILMGDFLLSQAFSLFVSIGSKPTLDILARATVRLSNGAIHQIEQSGLLQAEEDIYMDVIGDKTASLFSAACEIGAVCNGEQGEVRRRMAAFGEQLGLAFQITDDILDYEGRQEEMGKPAGADLMDKTLTLPLISAMNTAPPAESEQIRKLVEGDMNPAQWQTVRSFIHAHNGIGYSATKAQAHAEQARRELEYLAPTPSRQSLRDIVSYAVNRRE